MSDQEDKPTLRFGDDTLEVMAALDEVNQPARGSFEETHLDARGVKRRFRLALYGGGEATFLSAVELRADDALGLRLIERFDEVRGQPPFAALRARIRARLATRDLARDPDNGRLQLLTGSLRAQLTVDPTAPEGPPAVLVDDELISWSDLGELLSAYEGFGLRLELHEE
jgi:hypothetical protein